MQRQPPCWAGIPLISLFSETTLAPVTPWILQNPDLTYVTSLDFFDNAVLNTLGGVFSQITELRSMFIENKPDQSVLTQSPKRKYLNSKQQPVTSISDSRNRFCLRRHRTSTLRLMTSQARVPDELWVEVFNHLPRTSLKDVSSTYRTFSRILRPLGFSDFDFHPYAIGAVGSRLLPSARGSQALLRAVENLVLPRNSPARPFLQNHSLAKTRAETPYILLVAFIDRFACFAGFQTLYALHVD
ncbi:hypothetical protein DFH09DRAFT_1085313 [Mycena vulgaris]|nr:hypothetical protein DFH09DRAFT_1085313 [Mycena vulgaris]